MYHSCANVQNVTCGNVQNANYGAHDGLYTLIGRWYGNKWPCGEGGTTGGGVVSCTTAAACRRLSRALCAGDSGACTRSLWGMETAGEPVSRSSAVARREGDVGGV